MLRGERGEGRLRPFYDQPSMLATFGPNICSIKGAGPGGYQKQKRATNFKKILEQRSELWYNINVKWKKERWEND